MDGLEQALGAWAQADSRNRALLEAMVGALSRALQQSAAAAVVPAPIATAAPPQAPSTGVSAEGLPQGTPVTPDVAALDPEEAARRLRQSLETAVQRVPLAPGRRSFDLEESAEPAALDWALVRERLAVKAKCCEFVARRAEDRDANVSMYNYRKQEYEALISRANQSGAQMWMLTAPTTPVDVEQMRVWAEVFRNASMAAGIADGAPITRELLELVAHAQSAVRAIADDADLDQAAMYYWLREQTRRESIYLGEHMADDRRADPADWSELRQQLSAFEGALRSRRDDDRRRRNALTKIRHHVKRIRSDADAEREPDASDWRGVERGVQDLIECGVDEESEELCVALEPIGDLASTAPEALRSALSAAGRTDREPDESLRSWERSPTRELLKVREFLRGRELVLIGGIRKDQAERAIVNAFELSGVRWIAIGPHKSLDHFRADVARPEVALVVNLIRFSSHSYDEIAKDCKAAGKAYVRLTAGYSPNQIAAQVWEQISEQIEGNEVTAR